MWNDLPREQREQYKRLILAFASLTEAFAQKADEKEVNPSPIINSKFQETVFQKSFNATAEDIGNTSYDSSINDIERGKKYLIGIKTFGISSGEQKVAQFKRDIKGLVSLISEINKNVLNEDGTLKEKSEADLANKEIYYQIASFISDLRNQRIDSAIAQIQGFSVSISDENVESVYHVLMPSKRGQKPSIYVGETNYDKIDIEHIRILGSTNTNNPGNFEFSDGKHKYKFTAADSQLYMDFDNKNIVKEKWDVKYAKNAYEIFHGIAESIYGTVEEEKESYSWMMTNQQGQVELFSGFNAFYGVGSKETTSGREVSINKLKRKYSETISKKTLESFIELLKQFRLTSAPTMPEKMKKVSIRKDLLRRLSFIGNEEFKNDVLKMLFRPQDELYIPFPHSKKFHTAHPDFFAPQAGTFKEDGVKLAKTKEERKFNLVFEPSGESLEAFITQDAGKAIESYKKQSFLGDWILRKVFQLDQYEPLTANRLNEIGINGIRLTKYSNSPDIHLEFIWIDKDNLPEDYFK